LLILLLVHLTLGTAVAEHEASGLFLILVNPFVALGLGVLALTATVFE
jgi:hypothetical protein